MSEPILKKWMNIARNTRQALKINFNLEIEENVSCYLFQYFYENVPILTIAWTKRLNSSAIKFLKDSFFKYLEVCVAVSLTGLASNLIENEALAIK